MVYVSLTHTHTSSPIQFSTKAEVEEGTRRDCFWETLANTDQLFFKLAQQPDQPVLRVTSQNWLHDFQSYLLQFLHMALAKSQLHFHLATFESGRCHSLQANLLNLFLFIYLFILYPWSFQVVNLLVRPSIWPILVNTMAVERFERTSFALAQMKSLHQRINWSDFCVHRSRSLQPIRFFAISQGFINCSWQNFYWFIFV